MSASASFDDVKRMLDECAPGYTLRLANHSRVVTFNGKVYRSLPKHKNVELGHVRKMIRHLGINQECAGEHGMM
jgi:hypothetical protein